jgi:hypothetical protein
VNFKKKKKTKIFASKCIPVFDEVPNFFASGRIFFLHLAEKFCKERIDNTAMGVLHTKHPLQGSKLDSGEEQGPTS